MPIRFPGFVKDHDSHWVQHNPYALSLAVSYLGIRRAIGNLGLALPIILGPVGYLLGIPLQVNMSTYYHTGLRDVFVGVMCAMSVFFYCYRGYNRWENVTSFLACLSAASIALCPIDPGLDPLEQSSITGFIHTISGGIFFSTLAIFSLFHFPRGHFGLKLQTRDEQRDAIYFASGLTLLAAMLVMGIHLFLLPTGWKQQLDQWCFTFWMEWAAIWAFSSAWLTKGHALLADSAIEGFRILMGQGEDPTVTEDPATEDPASDQASVD